MTLGNFPKLSSRQMNLKPFTYDHQRTLYLVHPDRSIPLSVRVCCKSVLYDSRSHSIRRYLRLNVLIFLET